MANFPILQEIEGEWRSSKTVEIMGLRIPTYFTDNPQVLYDYIVNFKTRSDDVFVVSYPKSGTTWLQEIVWQIYHNGEVNSKRIGDRLPFLEEATKSKELRPDVASLPSPRLIKTHLSYEAIPKGTNEETTCKYIYIARNPKDVAVSNYKFHTSLGKATGLNAPWEFYANLFVQGKTLWSHWDKHVLGWWKHRDDANVLFLKYEDLKKDLLKHVRIISEFLNKPLSHELLNRITEQCTFNGMMKNLKSYLLCETEDGPKFLRKGAVEDWKNFFTPEQSERFDKELLAKLDGSGLEFEM
ncbi:sulfotransferase 1C4-like [Porites lutea]|uniref:sulfotransferase 1C4-like n=1 Tax=Porites lutea TaxID=51062 RepID=UPI003CC57DA4